MSVESVSSTRILTFVSTSLNRRSLIFLEVTNLPSRPANGLSLTMKFMDIVGSSIFINGIGSMQSGEQAVSPIFMSPMPEMQTISPAAAESTSTRESPSN